MKNYKSKICKRCGREYIPISNGQKYCSECIPEAKRERCKQWHQKHPEQHRVYNKQWSKEHSKEVKEEKKQWYKTHSKKENERAKQWKKTNVKEMREIWSRHANKRNRNLGFVPLNKSFKNSVAHHLDKIYVIYMDEKIHQSIPHSVLKNINMDEINAIAFNYLGDER